MDPQACRNGLNNVCIYVGGPNRTPNLKYAGDKIILKFVLTFRASRSELQRFAAGLRWMFPETGLNLKCYNRIDPLFSLDTSLEFERCRCSRVMHWWRR